ncbi:hypothetical protein J437_LFUL008909 [Ladona fulva]|uniref:Uncharacterized protein n=1 Tax=Ladona fulva TaxID=123851 RepID=A0A8K0K6K9_LADFU|nr:hypothetical protein J437_LFUL008909 [Ladona fulva]
MEFELDSSLQEWARDKPLSILQLDPADRAVLRIAGLGEPFTLLLGSHPLRVNPDSKVTKNPGVR